MKPNWKDAPDWANWLAMNEDGAWTWFEEKPNPRVISWASLHPYSSNSEVTIFDTLEEKPNESNC